MSMTDSMSITMTISISL